eukprot:TRINITY_DN2290_c3_g1_i1.p2 TRINITY_DN2290_c3_g1~~TRINITY_DN2290_c3_g1_i1.p2  ORF type:complete len:165 (+),score=69.42 TRINITY_DN2290_c3_g1_i1:54-548(+)
MDVLQKNIEAMKNKLPLVQPLEGHDFVVYVMITMGVLFLIKCILDIKRWTAPDKAAEHKKDDDKAKPADKVKKFTRKEVAKHNTKEDCWMVINNKVYDVTEYVPDHQGGEDAISRYAGQDNSVAVFGVQHPTKVFEIIEDFEIGELVKEDQKPLAEEVVKRMSK